MMIDFFPIPCCVGCDSLWNVNWLPNYYTFSYLTYFTYLILDGNYTYDIWGLDVGVGNFYSLRYDVSSSQLFIDIL